ncbi:MAG: hypothetical protein OZ915_00190 [Ignavibacteriales bacterium]|nr:hypothetical protein [Ignavibacteriales bacterium]
MKNIFQNLAVIFLLTFCTVYSQSAGEIILKRTDLKLFPILRLSDIYSILPQIDLYTLDGYHHTSLRNNLFEQTPADITILINGVNTDFGFLDKVNLSQLPLDPNSIDSIVIKYYPVNYSGNYSAGVLIDFITKELPEDISFSLSYSTGNETGDPGPYRYTKYFSKNVDQFGPNTSFNSSYGNNNFGLSLNFIDQVSPATDEAILMRTPNFIFQNYQVRYSGLSVNSYFKNNKSLHSLFTAFSKTGQPLIGYVYGADIYFDDNLSTEIPYQSQDIYFVSGNKILLNDDDIISIDLNFKHSSAEQSKLSNDYNFKFDNLLINSKAGFKSSVGVINYFAGLSFEYQNLDSKSDGINHRRNITSFFASFDFRTSKKLKHTIDFNLRKEKRTSAFFSNITSLFEIDNQNLFMFSASLGNMYNRESLSGHLKNTGQFSFNSDTIVSYHKAHNKLSYLFNFDYNYKQNNTRINSGITCFDDNGLNYILNDFNYNDQDRIIENNSQKLFADIGGSRCGFYFGIGHRFLKEFEGRFYYRYEFNLTGDEIYKMLMKRIPAHKVFYLLTYQPAEDLYGSIAFTYLSSSEWIEYRDIGVALNDLYKSKLSQKFLIDFSITKNLWKEKIKVSAAIKNLLNNRIQYHPIGGTFDLTFYLKVEVNFNSVLKI